MRTSEWKEEENWRSEDEEWDFTSSFEQKEGECVHNGNDDASPEWNVT